MSKVVTTKVGFPEDVDKALRSLAKVRGVTKHKQIIDMVCAGLVEQYERAHSFVNAVDSGVIKLEDPSNDRAKAELQRMYDSASLIVNALQDVFEKYHQPMFVQK